MQILLGSHAHPLTSQLLRDFPVAVQAECHERVGVVRCAKQMVCFEQALQAVLIDAVLFEPCSRDARERLQACISAEQAKRTFRNLLLAKCSSSGSTNRITVSHTPSPPIERYSEKSDRAGSM